MVNIFLGFYWCWILVEWIVDNHHHLKDKHVLELGSGVGFCGIVSSLASSPSEFVMSDYKSYLVENMEENIKVIFHPFFFKTIINRT